DGPAGARRPARARRDRAVQVQLAARRGRAREAASPHSRLATAGAREPHWQCAGPVDLRDPRCEGTTRRARGSRNQGGRARRARSSLLLEEEKNRALPQLAPVGSAEEHARRFGAGVTEYMRFLAQRDVMTIRNDMDEALRTHVGQYTDKRPLEFFTEIDYRDPVLLRTHGYHWFDLARMEHAPNPDPLRRGALLYNIFNTRTEGFATAMEEMMMHLGLCDS